MSYMRHKKKCYQRPLTDKQQMQRVLLQTATTRVNVVIRIVIQAVVAAQVYCHDLLA